MKESCPDISQQVKLSVTFQQQNSYVKVGYDTKIFRLSSDQHGLSYFLQVFILLQGYILMFWKLN
jgi:hypothetical protein